MRWLIDTAAWSRRERPEVNEQISELIGADGELVLSPAVLLELLREPQGDDVSQEREDLEAMMETLAADAETFDIAAATMERLALHQPEAHRRPVADLITAALAHQHECGIINLDGDFDEIAERGGLTYSTRRISIDDGVGDGEARQQTSS